MTLDAIGKYFGFYDRQPIMRLFKKFNINKIDILQIDCEGYEYRVLQGAEQTIRRCRPIVVIEQKPHDMYSKDYGQFAAIGLLEDWGMVKLAQVKDDWIMGWR